jgi:hypothetical protein
MEEIIDEETINVCINIIEKCNPTGEIPIEYAYTLLQAYKQLKYKYDVTYMELRRYSEGLDV